MGVPRSSEVSQHSRKRPPGAVVTELTRAPGCALCRSPRREARETPGGCRCPRPPSIGRKTPGEGSHYVTTDRAGAGSGGPAERGVGPQNVLEEILAGVREDVARRQEQVSLDEVRDLAAAAPPAIDAYAALRKPGVAVIAEV